MDSIKGEALGKQLSLVESNTEKQSYIGPLAYMRRMKIAFNRFSALLGRSLKQNVRNTRVALLRLGAVFVQAEMFSIIFASVKDGKSQTKSIADRVALLVRRRNLESKHIGHSQFKFCLSIDFWCCQHEYNVHDENTRLVRERAQGCYAGANAEELFTDRVFTRQGGRRNAFGLFILANVRRNAKMLDRTENESTNSGWNFLSDGE